ncbi:MAG: FtsX-like permease family protein [Rhodobacteraceae bacterium]|nr:FtsX-like permease family protein [Paracoccaceae bacterium]MYF46063.1 FtsX-like permease family protein [Paracoccaceae bacterium]MYI92295.1 FtsX-like permease family protein [Paracoccaceae bacterium]
MIAFRYLKSKRSQGGVSGMTLISFLSITIAVFALVATFAVRTGFRAEFVQTVLGANPHTTIYSSQYINDNGDRSALIPDYEEKANRIASIEGVDHVVPVISSRLLISSGPNNTGVELFGLSIENIRKIPLINKPVSYFGDLENLNSGIAIGNGVARNLGVRIGDSIRLISPDGVKTAFGVSPRMNSYQVVYIFEVGRYDIDNTRVYLPFAEAQKFLNREGYADELAVFVNDPESVEALEPKIIEMAGDGFFAWSWKDSSRSILRALRMEDNLMFIVMSILVLVASFNIVSGLIMLVKNKSSSIGILRSVGLTRGSIMRIFFIFGALIGTTGTVAGVILGCLFAIYIDPIFIFVNYLAGGDVWDPSVRFLSNVPAKIEFVDVLSAVILSLVLTYGVTLIPASRAAKMYPGEAIRYE